ncbi:MAG: hypothetical protein WC994_03745 [Brumimicrobium sp.]
MVKFITFLKGINRKIIITCLLFVVISFSYFSQIVPPGHGNTNTTSTFAFGIKQDMNRKDGIGWMSDSYISISRQSSQGSKNLFEKPGFFIVNQEFYNRFLPNWEHSIALSYRRQNRFSDEDPFVAEDPAYKNEFRLYGRFSYLFKSKYVEITPTLRQEFMKYYNPDFTHYDETFRMRTRFRLKFTFNLTEDKVHKISLYSEQLFSTSRYHTTKGFSDFVYKDSRFTLFYSYSPYEIPFAFNIGYMNNLIGYKKPFSVHNFALDVTWKNPFKGKRDK